MRSMIANFKQIKQSISKKENIPSYILIAILFFTQLFYIRIPSGIFLNTLLATGAIFLFNRKTLNPIIIIAVYISIPVLYVGYLFLEYSYAVDTIYFISVLWTIYTILEYLSYKNYVERLKERIIRILIAAVYFGVVYLSIYLIITLLNTLLNANIMYFSWPFRLSNAIASVLAMLVLMYKEENPEIKHSGFFKVIVGKILPVLSIITVVLYIAVIVRQIASPIDSSLLNSFYPYFSFIMLIYVLSEIAETDPRLRKILAISMAISVLLYSFYKFNEPGVQKYYRIIANLLIAGWLVNNIREGGKSDIKLSALVFIIALLMISPLFGYQFIDKYDGFKKVGMKAETEYAKFKRDKHKYINPKNISEDAVYKNAYYYGSETEDSYDISKYNKVVRNIKLNETIISKSLDNLNIEVTENGSMLEVSDSATGKTSKHNIFDDISSQETKPDKVYKYEGDNYLIIIKSYMASELNDRGVIDFSFTELVIDVFY